MTANGYNEKGSRAARRLVAGAGGGGSPRPVMKTRSAFYLRTSALARAARRLCAGQLRSRHAARAPHQPVNAAPLRHLCASPQLASKSPAELRLLARAVRPRTRPRVTDIATRLGDHPQPRQPGEWDWLQLTAPSQRKQPERLFFPRPPKAPGESLRSASSFFPFLHPPGLALEEKMFHWPRNTRDARDSSGLWFCHWLLSDGSLLYERVPNKPEVDRLPVTPPVQPALQTQQNILKRTRPPFDEINGADGGLFSSVYLPCRVARFTFTSRTSQSSLFTLRFALLRITKKRETRKIKGKIETCAR